MPDLSKTSAGVAASSAAWGWLHRKSSIKNRKSLCHCERTCPELSRRSEAILLHNSLFLVRRRPGPALTDSIFTTTFAFLLLLFLIASPAHAKYGGGTGEPNDPYLIYDANQMNAIGADSNDWDKHFKLMADIDLSALTGTDFNIIGYYRGSNDRRPFKGVFDGNDCTISNFTYDCNGVNYIGLFTYIRGENAEIKDLGLINPNVDAGTGNLVGSLVGINGGNITNCYVVGGSVSGNEDIGGLVGQNFYGTISNCYATGSVSGDYVGGLVGANWNGTIINCYSTGSVSGDYRVGGLVGENGLSVPPGLVPPSSGSTISNCYSTGSVSGKYYVGGLVGENYRGTFTNCYSTGSVSGDDYVGGLVGRNEFGGVTDSFWDKETSGQATSAGGTPKTTAEMQTMSTFTDAGWDFVGERINGSEDIWMMTCEGMSYPKLSWWHPVLGDFLCPDGVDMRDFAVLAAQWRQPPAEPSADIAPNGGDNIVDRFDLAALADNWLAGF